MGYHANTVKMGYEMAQLLPKTDSTFIAFEKFKEKFGQDGSIMVLGINDSELFKHENFIEWQALGKRLKSIEGVDEVLSISSIFNLHKNTAEKKFDAVAVFDDPPENQEELDSLLTVVRSLPFYKGFIYTDNPDVTLAALTLDRSFLDSKDRGVLMKEVLAEVDKFKETTQIEVHYSGLPYIRAYNTTKVSDEIKLFIALAVIIVALILLLFFRSFRAMFFSMVVICIGVIWTVGWQGIFDFKITILTALIPPLMIVIGIPNCIFLINKYHQEFKNHGNQIKAISRVIKKIGTAIFLTNTTTGLGFGTFIFTNSRILVEFGIVAAIGIFSVFVVSIILLPIILSFQKPPKMKHMKHLERRWVRLVVDRMILIVTGYRKLVYAVGLTVLVLAIYGISLIRTTGNIADDLPRHGKVYQDLKFFEKNFKGVLPFEISIDTKKKGSATKLSTLEKIDKLDELLSKYPEFSKPVSVVAGLKFAKQAYYSGRENKYSLYNRQEMSFIAPYLTNSAGSGESLMDAYMDSNRQVTRVTAQMADVGSERMEVILSDLRPRIDSIFPPENYKVELTGTSVVWLAGTDYLVRNLLISLGIAIFLIALIMAFLFSSIRMVFVSLIPNLLPLLVTAGLMGYFDISIKPSTILVFSIAFGISVDDTIHYLATYREELKSHAMNLREATILALKETGVSMIYSSIILFFGFGVFAASDFGGTIALGVLVSMTLLIAMLSNLIILPSLLLSLDNWITTKAFKQEPMLQILDEESNLELNELELKALKDDEENLSK